MWRPVMLTDMLAVLHFALSALATTTPLCCYKQRRLALCAFIIPELLDSDRLNSLYITLRLKI